MYHAEFLNRKDYKGRRYRDDNGNPKQYCSHSWLIYPVFETVEEYHAKFIPQSKQQFSKFEGICQFCGEVIWIIAEDVVADREEFDKRVKEILEEKEND